MILKGSGEKLFEKGNNFVFDQKKIKDDLVRWISNYFEQNGKDCCAVIGISGGKDSTITAALCVEALGKGKVFGVLMPQGEQKDINISYEAVKYLGINYFVANIKNSTDALLASITESGLLPNKIAVINTPARVRMTVLYAVSAIINGRVANTCNLSEDWIGYSTKFGDSAGDFSPLSRLTVSEVKSIGRELKLPSRFIEKTPEDGVSGFSDEENFGFTYEVLDKYIRDGICEDDEIKNKIDKLNNYNLHKLRPIPCYEYAKPLTD
jgi:NAD+ synthase